MSAEYILQQAVKPKEMDTSLLHTIFNQSFGCLCSEVYSATEMANVKINTAVYLHKLFGDSVLTYIVKRLKTDFPRNV